MTQKYVELSDLTDSRMLMEHRLLPISIWFIYIVIAVVLSSLIWANVSEVDVVVKGRGVLRPSESVGTLTSKVTGRIIEMNHSRGSVVNRGDLILKIDDADLKVQLDGLLTEKEQLSAELEMTKAFISGIEKGKNPFDVKTEEVYFYQFEKYQIEQSINIQSVDLSEERVKRTTKDLLTLKALQTAIQSRKTPQTQSTAKDLFGQYQLELDALNRQKDEAVKQLKESKALYQAGSISRTELELVESASKSSEEAVLTFTNNYSSKLRSDIEVLESKLMEYQAESAKLTASGSSANQSQNSGFVSWQNQKYNLDKSIAAVDNKITATKLSLEQCNIVAAQAGVYNPVSDLAVGDMLLSGSVVGTVVPSSSEHYIAELMVSNDDVSRIQTKDSIKLKLDALPYKEYGFVTGMILTISPDAIFDEKSGQSYYKVTADIPKQILKSYKGKEKELKVGMAFEAHIVSERKKIMKIVLEKLQLSL